jgi:hypothetical protein
LFSGHGSPFFAWKRPRGLPVRCKPDFRFGDDFFEALSPSNLQFLSHKSRLGSIVALAMHLAVLAFGGMYRDLLQHPTRLN